MANISYKKADLFKRLIAITIDSMIALIASFIPFFGLGWFLAAIYMLFRDGTNLSFMNHRSYGKQVMKLKVISPGNPDKPVGLITSFSRNWLFLIPILFRLIPAVYFLPRIGQIFFFVLNLAIPVALLVYLLEGINVINDPSGKRLGDKLAYTAVVEE
jgi:uncharacterized RDD family membrane protein YckC